VKTFRKEYSHIHLHILCAHTQFRGKRTFVVACAKRQKKYRENDMAISNIQKHKYNRKMHFEPKLSGAIYFKNSRIIFQSFKKILRKIYLYR
jgi:hypothetical protein